MELIDRQNQLWLYLLPEQKEIVTDCEKLIDDARSHPKSLSDYSYVVFPMAKVYEGFLKRFLLDTGLIHEEQYGSDHFRIGKVLNPNLPDHLRIDGLYGQICSRVGSRDLAERFWQTWKKGRNLLFHYFPNHLQRLTLVQAVAIVQEIVVTMDNSLFVCPIQKSKGGKRVAKELK